MIALEKILNHKQKISIEKHFLECEYDCTMDGAWATTDEKGKEFLGLSQKEKKVYAHNWSKNYVNELMVDSERLLKLYGNDYFEDVFNLDLKGLIENYKNKN